MEKIDTYNKQELLHKKHELNPVIREHIKRITIFGSFSQPNEKEMGELRNLGKLLSNQGLSILIGGNYGYLKEVGKGAIENNGKVLVVGTTDGAQKGWKTENIKGTLRGVYYEGGYSSKKQGLLHESVGAYIVLPSNKLGTFTEMTEAIDKMDSFDKYLDKFPNPVIFVGDFWQEKFNQEIKPRIGDDTLEHIHFVTDQQEIPKILETYAHKRKKHEK